MAAFALARPAVSVQFPLRLDDTKEKVTQRIALGACTIGLALALASAAVAQEGSAAPMRELPRDGVRDIHRLGGSTALYKPPLTNVASLKRMANDPSAAANIRTVLGQAGLSGLADNVLTTLTTADTAWKGGACSDATPLDGTIVECNVAPGQTLQWMAYRPTGGVELGLLRRIRWAGPAPFQAYLFRVSEDNRTYTFLVPKICSNLSLIDMSEKPRVAAVPASESASVVEPPPPAAAAPIPMPPPALVPAPIEPPPEATVQPQSSAKPLPFFIDALVGKDRRVRPIEGSELEFGQCSPLVGVKFGVAKRLQNNWELAAAIGVAFSLVNDEDKVREHELFIDVEANKYLRNGVFLGTGLSLWDLTRSDSFSPAWMIHAGVPLAKNAKFPVYFLVEGRLFFEDLDEIDNNYQFWGGVRVHF
jgi:hypothetical protein